MEELLYYTAKYEYILQKEKLALLIPVMLDENGITQI